MEREWSRNIQHQLWTEEACSRGTSRLERLTLPLMSCIGSFGQGIARGKELRARRRPWQGTCAKVRSGVKQASVDWSVAGRG